MSKAIVSLLKSNKHLRKPDWGNTLPVSGNVPEAAQLACYWLSNWTQSPVELVPKGKSTSWFFQSPHRGLAVLTHGNQKDPCLSKLYIVGFAIIYKVVYLFTKRVRRWGIISLAVTEKAASSDSAAGAIINLMTWEIERTAPLNMETDHPLTERKM